MAKKGKSDTQKNYNRSVVFAPDMLEQIEKLAQRKGVSSSEIVRGFVSKGLSVTGYAEDVEYITGIIRQVVSAEINRQANRLAAMLFKVGAITSSNYFLSVKMLSDVISPSLQEDFKDINSNARKLGIDYMKQNGVGVVEFLEDDEAVDRAVGKVKTDFSGE